MQRHVKTRLALGNKNKEEQGVVDHAAFHWL